MTQLCDTRAQSRGHFIQAESALTAGSVFCIEIGNVLGGEALNSGWLGMTEDYGWLCRVEQQMRRWHWRLE